MIVYQALMSGLGAVAGVIGPAGEVVAVADDGSETRGVGENTWAYGVERHEVMTQRMPDGALRVRHRGRPGGEIVRAGAGRQLDRGGDPWRPAPGAGGSGDGAERMGLDGG
ncbi:hypothetical protein G6F58_013458 [Rhizopus delemar]|nr:hypothetical protein G6F58_013458 [Rhizopus delemar]